MEETPPGADVRLDLPLRIAEHLLPARGIEDGVGLQVPIPHSLLGGLQGQRQPLLALLQRLLQPLPLDGVTDHPHQPARHDLALHQVVLGTVAEGLDPQALVVHAR